MIYFSYFDENAFVGDVAIAVQDFASGSSTGAQNYTTTALTGVTPKAAIVMGAYHDIANDPGETTGGDFGFAAIANNQSSIFLENRHNVGTSNVQRSADSGQIASTFGGSFALESGTGSLISGGLSINYSVNDGVSRRRVFTAFAGDDTQAASGLISLGTGTSAISVSCGFQPDIVILYGVCDDFPGSRGSFFTHTFGLLKSDGTQRCVLTAEADADTAGGNTRQAILTNACGGQISSSSGTLTYKLTGGGFSSSGFQVMPSASTGSDKIAYLALKFTGKSTKIIDLSTPTSTGDNAITGVGFEPQHALLFLTSLEATDPSFPISTGTVMNNFCIGMVGDEQWYMNVFSKSGADPTVNSHWCSAGALQLQSYSGSYSVQLAADLTSFDSDGLTLNYTTAPGTAKKGFALLVS